MKYTPDFSSRFRILKGGKISLVVSALLAGTTMTFAAPSGGQVTTGSATINQSGSVTTINQSSNKASINWQDFSIGKTETVNFVQPSAQSVTLNRVVGTSRSLIEGAMNANGQVFLINPNGVLFANGSQINVGGLVASTLNITDANFQAGNYVFEGNSQNSIINMGTITANNGYVAMMGKTVQNEGTIVATMGNVQLASGEKISLNLNGNSLVKLTIDQGTLNALVENKGLIQADGGQVYLTTQALNTILDGMVNNTGIIEAQTLNDVAGKVILYAHGGTTNVSGTIDASGGFVETSGKNLGVADGTIIKAKKWLIDPENVVIESTGGAIGGASVSALAIQTALNSADVEIQADNDITVNEAIVLEYGLTLTAGHDINVNEAIDVELDELTLTAGHDINIYADIDVEDNNLFLNYGGQMTFGMDPVNGFIGRINLYGDSTITINGVEQTIIQNTTELQAMNDNLTGNYVLGHNIDMEDVTTWTPIGSQADYNDYSLDFKGSFNGLGHTIANLSIEDDFTTQHDEGQAAGLFGNIAGATIAGVALVDAYVNNTALDGDNYIYAASTGGLVGSARALRDYSYAVIATPTIHNNIVAFSNIAATGDENGVGGIVGWASDATISGNVVVNANVLSFNGGNVGGIAGGVDGSVISDSYVSNVTVGGLKGSAGGIVGGAYDSSRIIDSAVETGVIHGWQNVGGIVGYLADSSLAGSEPSTVENSFYDREYTQIAAGEYDEENDAYDFSDNFITLGAVDSTQFGAWIAGGKTALSAESLLGAADANGYHTVSSEADFRKLLALAYDPSVKIKLGDNITLTEGLYLPLFMGEIDGNGKTISGLNVQQSFNSHIGLIGRLYGGTVKNLTIDGASLDGYAYVGAVAGSARGGDYDVYDYETEYKNFPTIADVTVNNFTYSHTDEMTTQRYQAVEYIGGIAGNVEGATLSNLNAGGTIDIDVTVNNDGLGWQEGAHHIGGLFGAMDDSTLSTAASSVASTITLDALVSNTEYGNEIYAKWIGGLAGEIDQSIVQDATASGNIEIDLTNNEDFDGRYVYEIGGLAGIIDKSYIKNATTTNEIDINSNRDVEEIGGIAGTSDATLYDTVNSSGDISFIYSGNAAVSDIGGMIGSSYDNIIQNATITRDISLESKGASDIGGIVGNFESSTIKDSSYTGTIAVTGVDGVDSIGGLVGDNTGSIEDQSYADFFKVLGPIDEQAYETQKAALLAEYNARADVIALTALGYTVQDLSELDEDSGIYNVYFEIVTPENAEWGVIQNSTATVDIQTTNGENIGGLVGNMNAEEGGYISNSSVAALNDTAKVSGFENVGGLVGYNDRGNILDSHASIEVVADASEGSAVGGLVGNHNGGVINSYVYARIEDSYDTATELTFATQQEAVDKLNELRAAFTQTATNENSGYEFSDDNLYTYFNGTNFVIDGSLKFSKSTLSGNITNSYAAGKVSGYLNVGGLVGENNGDGSALIKDSYATGAVDGGYFVGGLVGQSNDAAFENVYATGAVSGSDVGGLIGLSDNNSLENAYSTGTVEGESYVGGLVGFATATTISNSYHTTGKVTRTGTAESGTGGLVGWIVGGDITDSYATSEVEGIVNIGGLAGYAAGTSVVNSYATGKVMGSNSVGGLIGIANNVTVAQSYTTGDVEGSVDSSRVGGFMGYSTNSTIDQSYATGNVSGRSFIGGFIGFAGSDTEISDTYARGSVTADGDVVGSFAGKMDEASVTNSYASGKINLSGLDQTSIYGFVGSEDESSITNSFYNKTLNTGMEDEESYGKTTTELKTLATYTEALGDSAWDMAGATGNYPILGFQTENAETKWVMVGGVLPVEPTPNPAPNPTSTPAAPQNVDDIVTTIVNQTTVTPQLPVVTPLAPQPTLAQTQTNQVLQSIMPQGGYGLVGTTDGANAAQTIGMDELQTAASAQGINEIRVPLGQDSMVELINGGVHLPKGVSQEFYVVAANDVNPKGSTAAGSSSSDNKKKK